MATIVRNDIDNLNTNLTLTLEKSDYEDRWISELNKYKKQATMKGFRKGKTPLSVVKKMYGKPLLAEIVNETVNQKISEYIQEQDLDILGYPISAEDQELLNFDTKDLGEFVFKFDLGLAPEFEVKGASDSDTYIKHDVQITDEMIDTEVENARKQLGQQAEVEDTIQENDIVTLDVEELEDGKVKEEGQSGSFSVLVKTVVDEEVKNKLLESKNGDTLEVNLLSLEEKSTEEYARTYYLSLDADSKITFNPEFKATITKVLRLQPAELDQDFFDKFFGEGEVSSEEEMRAKIKENIKSHFDRQAEALLFRDMQEALIDQNDVELPEAFLKRWLMVSNEDKVTEEQIEAEFDDFKKSLRWSLVRGKLLREFDIKIEEADIRKKFADDVRNYLAGQSFVNDDFINSMVERMMADEEQVNKAAESALTDKLAEALEEKVTIQLNEVTVDEINEIIQKINNPEPQPQPQEVNLQTGLETLGEEEPESQE